MDHKFKDFIRIFALIMKRISLIAILAATMFAGCSRLDGKYTLHILSTNDVHGAWFDTPYVDGAVRPSLMAVNTYVDSIRKAAGRDNVLLIDAGDCLQGDNATYYYNYVDTVDEHLFSRLASYMGYDAVVVGNHDVETGPAVYDRVAGELARKGIPFMAGNALKADGKAYFPEYKLFKRAGLKVLVMGYTNPNIPAWLDKSLWPDMEFESLLPFVQGRVDELRAKTNPDVVVVSVHSGTGKGDGEVLEFQGLDLFNSLKGVDVLLCSHDHAPFVKQGDGICLVNTGSRAKHLGQATVTLRYDRGRLVSKSLKPELLDIDASKTDAKMKAEFAPDFEKVKAFTLKPVGRLSEDMFTKDAFAGQSFYMDLIHKVQLSESGADISFSAPLTMNGKLSKGELVFNDMFTLYPYENSLCVLELSGREIKNYLELSYDKWIRTVGPDGHIFNISERGSERYGTSRWSFDSPSFNFDSAAGVDYTVDVTRPMGRRVKMGNLVDGRKFALDATYKVAMTSYRAAGGGNLLSDGAGLSREELTSRLIARYPEIRDMIYKFVVAHEEVSPALTRGVGHWYFVPESVAAPAIKKDMALLF